MTHDYWGPGFNNDEIKAAIEDSLVKYEYIENPTKEAAEALGFSHLQSYRYIILPLAFRVSLPALNNNLVNLVKTTTQAMAIAVPELLYQMVSIYNDYSTSMNASMLLLFVVYITLVGILVFGVHRWEKNFKIPGYGGYI